MYVLKGNAAAINSGLSALGRNQQFHECNTFLHGIECDYSIYESNYEYIEIWTSGYKRKKYE